MSTQAPTSTLPRVTEILVRVGLATYPSHRPDQAWYMSRGQALHLAIELDATGELDEDDLHPEIAGAFSAYRKFCGNTQHVAWHSELEIVSERLGYQGHLDRVGLVGGVPTIIDWKIAATVDERTVTLQLAGYDLLYDDHIEPPFPYSAPPFGDSTGPIEQHLVVLLRPDGTYKPLPVRAREHRQTFLATLVVYRAMTDWRSL